MMQKGHDGLGNRAVIPGGSWKGEAISDPGFAEMLLLGLAGAIPGCTSACEGQAGSPLNFHCDLKASAPFSAGVEWC